MAYKVFYYEGRDGRSPGEEFYDSLDIKTRAKVAKWIEKLELEGPDLPRPYADKVRGKIRELRVRFGKVRYRFLYFFEGKNIIITHGFKKKTDKIPETELNRAEAIRKDFYKRLKVGEIDI